MSNSICNAITVTHTPGPEPIEIHRGVAVTHSHPKHWHEEYHFCAITGGGGYTEYRGTAYFTSPGSMFLLPPGEVHSNYANGEGCSYTNIYLPADRVEHAAAQIARSKLAAGPIVIYDQSLHHGFLTFCSALEDSSSKLRRDSAYLDFFETLFLRTGGREPAPDSDESRVVKVVREFLDEHYDRDIGLEHLARLSDLSPFHLNRTFRRQLGMPPHAYQIQRRIARAKVLLRECRSIADVAHSTGFADQSHFTRHFKRMVGVTPGRFVPGSKNVQDLDFAAD